MARGFGTTRGVGTTDIVNTGVTVNHVGAGSWIGWSYRTGAGGLSLGRYLAKPNNIEITHDEGVQTFDVALNFTPDFGSWTVPAPPMHTWYHWAVTHDGSSASDPLIYINALRLGTTETVTPSGTRTGDANVYAIGNRATDAARHWDGLHAEIAFWHRVLRPDEIWKICHLRHDPRRFNPIDYWPLDRDLVSRVSFTAGTRTGTQVAAHAVVRPRRPFQVLPSAAVSARRFVLH